MNPSVVTLPAAVAAILAVSSVAGAVSVPLSQQSIDEATFEDWQARQRESEKIARSAKADPTIPEPDKGLSDAEERPDAVGRGASDSVEVTGEPDAEVETPAYSTDLPDEAGLTSADETDMPDPFLVRLQVLLDRAQVSPGVIDGLLGENTKKAIRAYEAGHDLPVDGEPDRDLWNLLAADEAAASMRYTLTEDDVSGRYVESIPEDYSELADMDWLGYSGPAEMLAERFHMDEDLLERFNPEADFSTPGETILVTAAGDAPTTKVARIEVDRETGTLFAYGDDDALVMSAPATIGSQDTPSPSGEAEVLGVAPEPTYSYDPEKNFQQGDNVEDLTIPPGPNGPVGSVWIELSKPTYGIHGTAEPALIDKTQSHGCVRLTNWDAEALATLVRPGQTMVEFKG